ncbi:hypothetical protein [Oerskovia merdavium]|uniref:DUF3846 domain-containing protein n=1 Tax=Oerskovia merdavium TaxID=2762227 RepID=A0ABR8U526_9CELL|nr:hypothetical protein [Oerskovia merdavium]MBD7982894.1 hypothetical protein [Oerskovia merdavium]
MPTELVLLTRAPLETQALSDAADHAIPAALVVDVDETGVRLVLDPAGDAVATFYATRAIGARADADHALREGSGQWPCWTDVTIPYGDPTRGRDLALLVARAVGGVVKERN